METARHRMAPLTMQIIITGLVAVLLITSAAAQSARPDVEIMILGTFHFTGGGSDEVNAEVDDFLAPARQAEIVQVIERLAAYAPDKIMLEMRPEDEGEFNAKYKAYLAGKHALSVNERQQLGMRLAARLNHSRLYGIDFWNSLDYRPALAAAEALNQSHLTRERDAVIDEIIERVNSQKGLPLKQWLMQLNAPGFGSDHYSYLTIAQMGTVQEPQGALQIIKWWERNLVMFARTAQYAEPGEKILIIVGAGHKHLLHQFFEEARGFKLISPLDYLSAD